jgi:hypothetical protein
MKTGNEKHGTADGVIERVLLEQSHYRGLLVVAFSVVIVILIGLTSYRTYKNYSQPKSNFDWSLRGHSDFHNGAYYPGMAFRDKVNPYAKTAMEHYPLTCPSRPCPPINFIVHIPFTYFDLHTADVIFFVFNLGLLFLLAYFSVVMARGDFDLLLFLGVSSFLLISRPGHITLFTGYHTLELVLGVLIALHYADRKPWIAALGMLVASGKPTFILPLIILMVARKNYRATIIGIVLCTIAGVGGLAWLASESSFPRVIAGIVEGQEAFHSDETEFPVNTWTRLDLVGMFAKLIDWRPDDKVYLGGMLVLLIVPFVAIRRIADRESNSGAAGLSSSIVIVATLLCIYHHSYDCLLLIVPLVGCLFFTDRVLPGLGYGSKWTLGVALAIPFANYFSTQSARGVLGLEQTSFVWQLITLVNGLCLIVAMAILLSLAMRLPDTDLMQLDEQPADS